MDREQPPAPALDQLLVQLETTLDEFLEKQNEADIALIVDYIRDIAEKTVLLTPLEFKRLNKPVLDLMHKCKRELYEFHSRNFAITEHLRTCRSTLDHAFRKLGIE
jgi:hypothetical protein